MLTAEQLNHLETTHRDYAHFNQKERSDVLLMAELGHPKSGAYRDLRAYFDTLRFAANAAARFISWQSPEENAEYWAPKLSLAWRPTGLPGFRDEYPASGERWLEYIRAAAAAGWPEGVAPKLDGGLVYVRTSNEALRAALKAFSPESAYGSSRIYVRDIDMLRRVVSVIDAHMGTLPARTPADEAQDEAPLPLAERPLRLAKVDAVRLTDHAVLVPLVQAGPAGEDEMVVILEALTRLLDQGWGWDQAESYFKDALKPAAFRRLARQYGAPGRGIGRPPAGGL